MLGSKLLRKKTKIARWRERAVCLARSSRSGQYDCCWLLLLAPRVYLYLPVRNRIAGHPKCCGDEGGGYVYEMTCPNRKQAKAPSMQRDAEECTSAQSTIRRRVAAKLRPQFRRRGPSDLNVRSTDRNAVLTTCTLYHTSAQFMYIHLRTILRRVGTQRIGFDILCAVNKWWYRDVDWVTPH